MAKKPTLPINTPLRELEWVIITGEGSENLSGVMQYKAQAVFAHDDPELLELEKKILEFFDENRPNGFPAKRKPKSIGIYPIDFEKDEDGDFVEDDNGKKIPLKNSRKAMVFKTGTTWPDGNPKVIKTYNARGKPVNLGERKVGNGTIGAIYGAAGVYASESNGKIVDAGVTLYLNGIQIKKLVEYTDEIPVQEYDVEEGDFDESTDDFDGDPKAENEAASKAEEAPTGGAPRL